MAVCPDSARCDPGGPKRIAPSDGVSQGKTASYRRHEREKTLLYQIVSENLETFLAEVRDHYDNPLPAYVEKELRDYLDCGILARGFVRGRCDDCGRSILVALSCKRRRLQS
ncbi:transposase zinc-binding domain-containing protein [Myxococcota bacterium]